MTHNCPICGKSYRPEGEGQRACSVTCRRRQAQPSQQLHEPEWDYETVDRYLERAALDESRPHWQKGWSIYD